MDSRPRNKNICIQWRKKLPVREPNVFRLKHPTWRLKKIQLPASLNSPLFRLGSGSGGSGGTTQTAAIKAPRVLGTGVILGLMTGNVTLSGFVSLRRESDSRMSGARKRQCRQGGSRRWRRRRRQRREGGPTSGAGGVTLGRLVPFFCFLFFFPDAIISWTRLWFTA